MGDFFRRSATDPRWLTIFLATGVLVAHFFRSIPSPAWIATLLIPAVLSWPGRALWIAFSLGLAASFWQGFTYLEQRWPEARHGELVQIDGHIASLVEKKANATGAPNRTLRFRFEPVAGQKMPDNIRVSWYRSQANPRAGECWRLSLRMRTPRGSMNPGSFDYEAWLYRQGIAATATVKAAERCDAPSARPILKMRRAILEHIEKNLGRHPSAPLISALVLGADSDFSDQDWDNFRVTGTTHLVAISGFNVAILAGFAYLIARWSWPFSRSLVRFLPAQKAARIIAAIVGLAYSLLAGWDSPAQRAALMLAVILLASLPSRNADPSRALALVMGLMLLFDPAACLSPGLWLSFGAVVAIYYVTCRRLCPLPAWRAGIHLQVMLSVLLAPLTLFFFQGAAWMGPFVNLLAVPLMTLLTPAVVASVGLSAVTDGFGPLLLLRVADILSFCLDGLQWLATEAPAAWVSAAPTIPALLLAILGAIQLFSPRGWPAKWLGPICFVPLLFPPVMSVRGTFELVVMDVGQGLSALVRTANHSLLYDAGPAYPGGFDAGESVVVPHVLATGRRRVDHLMLSHGDLDHAGGVNSVRRMLSVSRESGTEGHEPCVDGQSWIWDEVKFEVLHPNEATWSDNNRSCVLRVSSPDFSVLLAGDIERAAEQRLLDKEKSLLKTDVLVAPHHGSRTSSSESFVNAVSPELVIFPAAWRSHYGHPVDEVQERYERVGASMLTSGVVGSVRIWRSSADSEIQYQAWRPTQRRFWNAEALP